MDMKKIVCVVLLIIASMSAVMAAGPKATAPAPTTKAETPAAAAGATAPASTDALSPAGTDAPGPAPTAANSAATLTTPTVGFAVAALVSFFAFYMH